MEYVFEDNKKSMLVSLYERAYLPSEIMHFHYTNGSARIVGYIKNNFDINTGICIFLDLPPGNQNVRQIYSDIKDLIYKSGYKKIIVIPIVCREYYYLKMLSNTRLVIDQNWVDNCLRFNLTKLLKLPIIETDQEKKNITTFEKICKLIAKKGIKECGRIGKIRVDESGHRPFIYSDCAQECSGWNETCIAKKLNIKGAELVMQFPVFPCKSIIKHVNTFDWESAVLMHRKLVDTYNIISDKLDSADLDRFGHYSHIDYLY